MACALTRFGQHCRELRSRRGMTIGDQADAFGAQPHEISAIETGKLPIPPRYSEKLAKWLGLNEQEQRELRRRTETNVVTLRRHVAGGDKTSAMRLFRRISKMNPNEIRNFRKRPPPEVKDEQRL
jgi:transcriptional regulator with XRE-family HTH domain